MFQFTTTNVINSDKDLTTNKPLWTTEEAEDDKPAILRIKRVGNFKATNVTAIYKAEAEDAQFAKATIDFSQLGSPQKGDILRLNIYIGLSQASQDSRYANDLQYKGKSFSVDFSWEDSAANTVKKLAKDITKYEMLVYGDKLLDVSSNSNFLTIEAKNEYQRFKVLNVEKFNEEAYHGMGDYAIVRQLSDLAVKNSNAKVLNSAEGFFMGKEGFGTYPYLLHNIRIPTYYRSRAFGINQDETPIVGAKYNEYIIHYCTNRGILGTNAVGDTTKSMTTHVFYVKSDLVSSFETALKKVGNLIEVGPGKDAPDPSTIASGIEDINEEIQGLKEQIGTKQNTITAGDGVEMSGSTLSVKIDGDTLSKSANGLKVADGKFTPAK